jgi:hypothetical protein
MAGRVLARLALRATAAAALTVYNGVERVYVITT